MKYQFIQKESPHHDVTLLCNTMKVSRSGYYSWVSRAQSNLAKRHALLEGEIKLLFDKSRQTYGYRRITRALQAQGKSCGKHQVLSLMRKLTIRSIIKRKFKATINSQHNNPIYDNKLNREFNAVDINQKWTADITYISTQEGWLYLAVVIDLFSRTIVGWAMDNRMTEKLAMSALRMALFRRKVSTGLLLHSDRGSQYASHAYQRLLKEHGILCSMSRKGNCWDNAPTESFFKTLKVECIYRQSFKTREEAKHKIFDYIEVFYNGQRQHSTLNYLSPKQYELTALNL